MIRKAREDVLNKVVKIIEDENFAGWGYVVNRINQELRQQDKGEQQE